MIFYLCILGVISSSGDLHFAPMALWALPLGPGVTSDAKVQETPAISSSYGQVSPVIAILVLACRTIIYLFGPPTGRFNRVSPIPARAGARARSRELAINSQ